MRDSFIFYKSFYDSIKELDLNDQVQIYNAIFNYQFEGREIELKGICKSIFALIIPQLDANNKRYENGCKGGRPKNQNKTKIKPKRNQNKTKTKPNDNDNDNVNDNDNDIISSNNIYGFIEENFGRLLAPLEYQEVSLWKDNDLTRYAIKQAVLNGKYNIKYISRILFNYEKNNIKTVQQAQENERQFKNKNIKNEPEWFNQEIQEDLATEEDEKEIKELLKDFK